MISRQLLLSPLLFSSSSNAASASSSSPLDVSNATNSMCPDDLKSRIFIGNLATAVTKRALHAVFTSYGQIKAISLHKGYAFIQYSDEMDAINAVIAQDGQLLAGQVIDVNLVTSPKAHQKSAKRDSAKDSCDSNDSTDANSKRPRVEVQMNGTSNSNGNTTTATTTFNNLLIANATGSASGNGNGTSVTGGGINNCGLVTPANQSTAAAAALLSTSEQSQQSFNNNVNSNAQLDQGVDIMICGTCKTVFTCISEFMQHKKSSCRLRFVCRCR